MNLAKEISFLLYKHKCVILPGFGAFLINEKKAERNTVAKYATPRQEVISFNKQIINNDGLVANFLTQKHDISYEEGITRIENYIASLWDILNTKKNVEVAEVGTFYLTKENKLVFVPYHSVNFSISSFGLPKLRLKPYAPVSASPERVEPAIPAATTPPELSITPETTPAGSPKTKEKKEIAVTAKHTKQKERREASQAKKLEKKIHKDPAKRKKSNLYLVNILGSLFILGILGALYTFETNASKNDRLETQVASMLDLGSNDSSSDILETKTIVSSKVTTTAFYGIYALTENEVEASNLATDLMTKYAQSKIVLDENGKPSVFIISFSNKEMAQEYKSLIQNNMNQKLVITKK